MKIANLKDPKNKNLLLKFQDKVLNEFNRMLKDMANTNYKKSALITYWLNDYKNYLHREEFFTPKKLVKYKRGSIIKANLGFNLGNEQGGLHYCIVLNKNDTINIPTLNVIPLTSMKDPEKKLHYTNVNLGNEVYNILVSKIEENSKLNELYLSNIESMNHIVDEMLSHLTMCKDFGFDKEILNSSKPILDMLLTDFKSIINEIDWKDKYLISNLNLKEDKLKSEISIYSIEGEKIHNLDIKGEIVFFSEFIKDEIIALTDANLYLIKDGDIQWKKPFYSIKDVEHKDNRIYILYDNILEVVDLKGRTEEKFIIGSKYNKILPFGKYILLYGNNDLLGIQGSRQVINYKHPEEIIKIDTNKSMIGIYGDKKLELFKLINKT